jgi:hypothetical protein
MAENDFFGTQYLGVNPYGAEASDRVNRLSTLDQMLQSWFQPQAQAAGTRRNAMPGMAYTNFVDNPGDGNTQPGNGGGGGGGGNAPRTGCPDPGPPPTNCKFGYYLASGGANGCPYWTCSPDPGGNVPGGSGPSGPGTNVPPNNPGSPGQGTGVQNPNGSYTGYAGGGGGAGAAGGYTGMYGSLPPDLATLRSGLSSFLLGQMGQRFPMYGGNLTVNPDPNAMSASNLFSSTAGRANQMGGAGMDMIQQLFGYRAPNAGMPDFSSILSGSTPDAASALMSLGQRGAGDVGNYLNYGSGIINASLANNPFLTMNLGRAGEASNYFQGAANVANNAMGDPSQMYAGTSQYMVPTMEAFRNLANTGNAPNIQSALQAIEQRGQLAITDDLAAIREQYGARGLGAGSDVAAALAQGAARGRADITAQQSSLQADVLNQAANRMVSAQSLAPSLSGALVDPYNQQLNRELQRSGIYAGLGQGMTGLLSAGSQAGTGMQDALTRMAGVLGDYGRTSADATQAGTSALAAAGNLQAGSYDRILQALGIQSQHSLGQGQLANQAAGVNAQAAGMLPGLINSMTGAATTGASGQLDVAKYMSALQTGNVERPWQAWQQSQQYPFLNPAISFMTSMPQGQQMPIVSGNSGNADSMWGSAASGMVTALMMAGMFSSREFKHVLHNQMNSLWFAKHVQDLPVGMWYYKGMTPEQTHVGPMAEDFKKLYAVGDGITIKYIDAIGILFATVQGLSKALDRLTRIILPEQDIYA